MDQKEKALFKSLCSFQTEVFDKDLLDAATPAVLGHLFFNRMQSIAYGTLCKHDLLGEVNREFRNSLKEAYVQNCRKNESFFWCVEYIETVLSHLSCPYALLKGAYLCKRYPDGYRTSNDIDLLVHPRDVTHIGKTLLEAGFRQGDIRNGKFVPTSRKEIIESMMLRGETVPYIKEVRLPGMKFLEVDINFSLDYKPAETDLIEEMMRNTVIEEQAGFHVRTLRADDFFVHLCAHLYKEATTMPWVEMMRDMTLYKYCDVYMLLNEASREQISFLFQRANELGMEKVCAFAVIQMSVLFDFKNTYAKELAETILGNEPEFVHTIISPQQKKTYIYYVKDIGERFFSNNRKTLLQEVRLQ